jgi:hypothetical protein
MSDIWASKSLVPIGQPKDGFLSLPAWVPVRMEDTVCGQPKEIFLSLPAWMQVLMEENA